MIRNVRPCVPPPVEWLPWLEESYRARWFTNGGPLVARLEAALTQKYGAGRRRAVLVSSGTAGLVATLLALEIRGKVVVPAYTFPATAHAIAQAGCEPLLCDVSPDTWELCPSALRTLLQRERVAAVMHVRAYGFCRSLDDIEMLAAEAGVPLIVDAAAALGGSEPGGVFAGQRGCAEVFSLHATKVFAVGEGGLVMASPAIEPRIRRAINFGFENHEVCAPGLNGKLSELHAAVGLAMLARMDAVTATRQRLARDFTRVMEMVNVLRLPQHTGSWRVADLPGTAGERHGRRGADAACRGVWRRAAPALSPGPASLAGVRRRSA